MFGAVVMLVQARLILFLFVIVDAAVGANGQQFPAVFVSPLTLPVARRGTASAAHRDRGVQLAKPLHRDHQNGTIVNRLETITGFDESYPQTRGLYFGARSGGGLLSRTGTARKVKLNAATAAAIDANR